MATVEPNVAKKRRHLKTLSLSSGSTVSPRSRTMHDAKSPDILERPETPSNDLISSVSSSRRKRQSLQYTLPVDLSPTLYRQQQRTIVDDDSVSRTPLSERSRDHHSRHSLDSSLTASSSTSSSSAATCDTSPSLASEDTSKSAETPTFVEQHGELLSLIARKERTCLDLREELKRHEAELAKLKEKWQTVIATEHSTSLGTPLKAAASPMRPEEMLTLGDINSAKKWVGGFVKTGLQGVIESVAPVAGPSTPTLTPTGSDVLDPVQEEEDDQDDTLRQSPRMTLPTAIAPSSTSTDLSTSSDMTRRLASSLEPITNNTLQSRLVGGAHSFGSSLGRRFLELQNSESVKSSKKAAASFLDTFERTLADAILIPVPAQESDTRTQAQTPVSTRSQRPLKTWTARQGSHSKAQGLRHGAPAKVSTSLIDADCQDIADSLHGTQATNKRNDDDDWTPF